MQKIFFLLVLVLTFSCSQIKRKEINNAVSLNGGLIDKNATSETQSLYKNLKEISNSRILYGHQDDMAYGVNWWAKEGRSDVKEVCGSYPAVFGWELGNLGQERNIDSVRFDDIKRWMVEVHRMGGINTVSWHLDNPVSHKTSWDITKAVYSVLPGGINNESYKDQLKKFAKFNNELLDSNGAQIPVIFRALHEQNGNWFWWGKNHCTVDEYVNLFQFTVTFLRDSLNIHNLIYVYSPDGQFDDYIERYPGDNYVDILGFDYYFRNELNQKEIQIFTQKLIDLSELAKSKNKLAVLSETGYESIPDSLWHTKALLQPIKENREKIKIGYFLVWRNANKKHHYAPYIGHHSCSDFQKFYNDSLTVFINDLPKIYSMHE